MPAAIDRALSTAPRPKNVSDSNDAFRRYFLHQFRRSLRTLRDIDTIYHVITVETNVASARGSASGAKDEVGGEKRAKFREIAESRTNKAIDAIVRIGNLSNKQVYVYEEAEVRKIVRALKAAIAEVEARFSSPGRKTERKFKL